MVAQTQSAVKYQCAGAETEADVEDTGARECFGSLVWQQHDSSCEYRELKMGSIGRRPNMLLRCICQDMATLH